MRVRHFHTYIQSQRLVSTGRTESLRSLTLGVDAASWARGLLEFKDPFAELMGGLPLCTSAAIDSQLGHFAAHEIFPCFFFQGLSPNGHSLFTKIDSRAIAEVWTLVLSGNLHSAHAKLGRIASRLTEEFICYLARHLRIQSFISSDGGKSLRRRLAVFQCPYLSTGQISYFIRTNILDAVYGLPSFILVGMPRVITVLDFEKSKFEWVERDHLLRSWDITEQQLADACILAGTEYCHTLPHVDLLTTKSFSFSTALNLAKTGSLEACLQFFPDTRVRNGFKHLYSQSRALISIVTAMQGNGVVAPLPHLISPQPEILMNDNKQPLDLPTAVEAMRHNDRIAASTFMASAVPHDIRVVQGWKLPSSVFLLMLEGLLGPTLPKVLSYGEWRDVDTSIVLPQQYETVLIQCRSYRLIALGLIARHLHPSFYYRRITFEYVSRHCADPLVLLASDANQNKPAQYAPDVKPRKSVSKYWHSTTVLYWNITIKDVEHQLQIRNLLQPSLRFCLDWHLSSMRDHFVEEYATLPVECRFPSDAMISDEKAKYVDLGPMDVANIEQAARRHMALGNRRRRLLPAQNYVLTLVMLTFLECLGYFDFSTTPPGSPTALGFLLREKCHPDFELDMIVALELMKFRWLSGNSYTYSAENNYPAELVDPPLQPFIDVSAKVSALAKKWQMRIQVSSLDLTSVQHSIRIITRAISLTPVQFSSDVTFCPGHYLDFDIAAFLSIVKNVKRSLNHLVEGSIAHLVLEKPAYGKVITPDVFDPQNPKMLWFHPVLGVGGVIMRAILLSAARTPEEIQAAAVNIPHQFQEVENFWPSVLRLCEFWSQLSKIVRGGGHKGADDIPGEENLVVHNHKTGLFARADVLLSLQMWDFLPYINFSGELPQHYPTFCELVEKSLGVDLAAVMARRPAAPSSSRTLPNNNTNDQPSTAMVM